MDYPNLGTNGTVIFSERGQSHALCARHPLGELALIGSDDIS